jgi:AAA+ superfamily predicted ATPase
MPMHAPALFQGIRRPPKTFLLHGPPGTGKVRAALHLCPGCSAVGNTLVTNTPAHLPCADPAGGEGGC